MKRLLTIVIPAYTLFFSCTTKPAPLSAQLKANLSSHVAKIDSALVLDSFLIVRVDSIDQRVERAIDDTIYKVEFHRVQAQLANAIKDKKRDSIEFYKGEVEYMAPQADSLTGVIAKADTTKKLGIVASCKVHLRKHHGSQEQMFYYFLDKNMKIWNAEMIDSAIAAVAKKLD